MTDLSSASREKLPDWEKDLGPFDSWERGRIRRSLAVRYGLLADTVDRLAEIHTNGPLDSNQKPLDLPIVSLWQLATVDVFVEKAQDRLTVRSDQSTMAALATGILVVFVLGIAVLAGVALNPLIGHLPIFKWMGSSTAPPTADWKLSLVDFLRGGTLLGLILAVVYFLVSLTRAFLHEATILRNRRHSVRLGRLYLHLKILSARTPEELVEVTRDLKVEDIERCFGWNLESSTAFKDIRAEAMTTTLIGQVLATIQKGFEAFARK